MNTYIRLLCHIAQTKNSSEKDAEIVFDMIDETNQLISQLTSSCGIPYDPKIDINELDEQGMNPLMYAAAQGNIALMKYFVSKRKVLINEAPIKAQSHTALYHAAANNQIESVRYLLSQGAKLNSGTRTIKDESPISIAAKNNHIDMVRELMSHTSMLKESIPLDQLGVGKTIIKSIFLDKILMRAIKEAIIQNNLEIFKELYSRVGRLKSSNYIFGSEKCTFLHLAVLYNAHSSIIHDLLNNDSTIYSSRDANGFTPLELAAYRGNVRAVYALSRPEYNNHFHNTNSHQKIIYQITLKLLSNSDNAKIDEAKLIIFYLLLKIDGHIPSPHVIELIVQHRESYILAHYYLLILVLHYNEVHLRRFVEVKVQQSDFVEDIMEMLEIGGLSRTLQIELLNAFRNSALPNVGKVTNKFMLHIHNALAKEKTFDEFCETYTPPQLGIPPKDLVVAKPNSPIVNKAENIFSELLLCAIDEKDENKFLKLWSDLEGAINKGKGFLKFSRVVARYKLKLPNEWHLDLDYKDLLGDSLLAKALVNHKNAIAEFLLTKGVEVNLVLNSRNETPLLLVSRTGNLAMVERLIDGGASVSAVDNDGYNCLILATLNNKHHLYSLFHLKKVPFNHTDNNKISALGHALLGRQVEAIDQLLTLGAIFKNGDWGHVTKNDSVIVLKHLIESNRFTVTAELIHFILFSAAKSSALECIEYLTKQYKKMINYQAIDDYGNNLLHVSCESSITVFNYFLSKMVATQLKKSLNEAVADKIVSTQLRNFFNETVADKMVKFAYQSLSDADPHFNKRSNFIPMVSARDASRVVGSSSLPSDQLIDTAYNFLKEKATIYEIIQQLNLLFVSENEKNRLLYNDITQQRLSALRHYMGAGIKKMLEDIELDADRFAFADRIGNCIESFELGKVLNFHEVFPFLGYFFKSVTYKTVDKLVSHHSDPEKDLNSTMLVKKS